MNTFQNMVVPLAVRLTCCLGAALCLAQTPLRAQNRATPLQQTGKDAKDAAASPQTSGTAKGADTLPPVPAPAGQTEEARLRADLRLQRKVTLDETGTPLADLLNKLSSDKLTLKADADCGEFKLQIRLKQRPLYVLLQSLAQLYDGYWQERTDKQGYRFAQRLQTIRRRDAWWRLYLNERDQALGKVSADVVADMHSPIKARDPNAPEYQKEPGDPETEAQTARSHNAFGQFADTLQQRIAQAFDPIYTCDLDGFQGSAPMEGGAVVRLRDLPPDAQKIVQQHAGAFFSNDNPLIHFANTGDYIGAHLVRPGKDWPETGLHLGGIRRPDALAMAVCSVNHALLAKLLPPLPAPAKGTPPAPGAHAGRKPRPEGWQQLADWQRKRVWPNDAGNMESGHSMNPRRAERLVWLARQADIEYVSDYYARWAPRRNGKERDEPLAHPLKDELDIVAQKYDVSWKRSSDAVYLFRNNRWYRDDALEVPSAYARALLRRVVPLFTERPGEMPVPGSGKMPAFSPAQVRAQLELECEVTNRLTPWQIANGLKWYRLEDGIMPVPSLFDKSEQIHSHASLTDGNGQEVPRASPPKSAPRRPRVWCPFEEFAHALLEHHRLLDFYNGLGIEQRDALTYGRLAWSALSQEQQKQLAVFAPAVTMECWQAAPAESLLGIHAQFGSVMSTSMVNEFPAFFMPGILEVYTTNSNSDSQVVSPP